MRKSFLSVPLHSTSAGESSAPGVYAVAHRGAVSGSWRSLAAILTLLGSALFPTLAHANSFVGTASCSTATFTYSGFRTKDTNTVNETVSVDSVPYAKKTFQFVGGRAVDNIPIQLTVGSHLIALHTDFNSNGAVGSRDVTRKVTCTCSPILPSTADATADGSAYALAATVLGVPLIQPPLEPSSSNQIGPGTNTNSSGPLLSVAIGGVASITADVLPTSSTATITSTGATDESIATTGAVSLLNLVQATALKADARAFAAPDSASYSTAGTEVEGLVVAGMAINSIHPNEVIPIPGGTVTLLEQTASTSNANGRSTSDISINLIHIRLLPGANPLNLLGTDIIVGHAEAHADTQLAKLCPTSLSGSVTAEAFAAQVLQGLDPALNTDKVDDISIPHTGGSGSLAAHGFSLSLPGASVPIGSGTVSEQVSGSTSPSISTASASATVEGLCLLNTTPCDPAHGIFPTDGIGLSTATADTTSTEDGTTASSSPSGTTLATLSIGGRLINPAAFPPNTTFSLPGIATVTLNEQIPYSPATAGSDTGLTVNLLHLRLLIGGADVIVSSALTEAHQHQ